LREWEEYKKRLIVQHDKNYSRLIDLHRQIFYGFPLLVQHQKEIEHLFEDMNERHHRLRNAVHESGTSTEEAARRDVGTGLQRGTEASDVCNSGSKDGVQLNPPRKGAT
jgi:hypothetical protein